MTCSAGYPKQPCPFGYEGPLTRKRCGVCVNYVPPKYILAWCRLYDREQVVCLKPKSACERCPEKVVRAPGRPEAADSPVDWRDPESVKRYYAALRKANPTSSVAAMERFLKKHPDYFKQYMKTYQKANPEKFREANRRAYAKRKAQREQSTSQVRGDTQGSRSERDEDLPASRLDDRLRPGSS